jgi:hypothetical protein
VESGIAIASRLDTDAILTNFEDEVSSISSSFHALELLNWAAGLL